MYCCYRQSRLNRAHLQITIAIAETIVGNGKYAIVSLNTNRHFMMTRCVHYINLLAINRYDVP